MSWSSWSTALRGVLYGAPPALVAALLVRRALREPGPAPQQRWERDLARTLRLADAGRPPSSPSASAASARSAAGAAGAASARTVSDLRTPALLLYLDVARRNARAMLDRASALGVDLRPHVKTHKTREGAYLQTGGTKRRITCSTLAEVAHFGAAGFDDILYAVPITADKLPDAARLTRRLGTFHVMVDHPRQLDAILAAGPPAPGAPWSVVVMVDCGYHRDGVDPGDEASVELVGRICASKDTAFAGIYTHGGHSYDCAGPGEIRRVAAEERDAVVDFAARLRAAGHPCPMVGVGSTPTASHPPADGLAGCSELHPGNYFVYDVTQAGLGACAEADVATRVLTRVIGHYPQSNMLLIDLGWTGCSAQGKAHGYGRFEGHPELKIATLKQEAGEVTSSAGGPIDFARFPIGTMLRLMPWHSCAAGAMHGKVEVVARRAGAAGETGGAADQERVLGTWKPCRGWG